MYIISCSCFICCIMGLFSLIPLEPAHICIGIIFVRSVLQAPAIGWNIHTVSEIKSQWYFPSYSYEYIF